MMTAPPLFMCGTARCTTRTLDHRFISRDRTHVRALAGERRRDRLADTAARAGDETCFPVEVELHGISQVWPHSDCAPSMRSVAPVMYCAAGDARNSLDAATSSTVPARFKGVSAMPRSSSCGGYCFVPAELLIPGATAFTRIPNCAHSTASVIVMFSTPARAAPVCTIPGNPR